MNDEFFVDTNILVYAFDKTEKQKHKIAQELLKDVTFGKRNGVVSNQVLGELFEALTRKLEHPIEKNTAQLIVNGLIDSVHWKKINYAQTTVSKAIHASINEKKPFWDSLIVETMLENRVFTILTENTKDFSTNLIKPINPFKMPQMF
ncbi:MAG: PIN domain-containing protein [archaeon]